MSDRTLFDELAAEAVRRPGHESLRPVVEKELLHYDILFALDSEGLLDALTFQGGTSLRLLHGGVRFSEDLDFAGGTDFDPAALAALGKCIERRVGERYGLEVRVRSPREQARDDDGRVRVERWQVVVVTAPARPDLPVQRIKLEVANVPALSRVPLRLIGNYPFLPDGYADTFVLGESLDEIVADKLVALPSARHPRYRDLWDIPWALGRGAEVRTDWVAAKLSDYGIDDFGQRLDALLVALPGLIEGETFAAEMRRFLPADVHARTLGRATFRAGVGAELVRTFESLRDTLAS